MSALFHNSNDSSNRNDGEELNNEVLDPRIQGELELLNKSCADINKMENELEEAKTLFITSKNRQTQRLEYLQKKLGSCIIKAKPFYEASELTDKLQFETQRAVIEFQKANSLYKTAKETLMVAENSLDKGEIPDVWQEHLSTTVTKINDSKKAADQAEENHRQKANEYQLAEKRMQYLEKELKRYIIKSKLYYDEKSRWQTQMEAQKMRIHDLEQALIQTKNTYKEAMRNLSKISEDIHCKRQLEKSILIKSGSQNIEQNVAKMNEHLEITKIELPKVQEQTNTEKISNYLNNNDLKPEIIEEYVSLGLNSTASNSRCSSPSNNSLIDDVSTVQLNINQAMNKLELIREKSELSSKANSFSSSSMSHGSSFDYYTTPVNGTNQMTLQRSLTMDTGFLSQSSELDVRTYESFEEQNKIFKNESITPKLNSFADGKSFKSLPTESQPICPNINTPIESSIDLLDGKTNKANKKINRETPLLSNLLLNHTRF